jgi:ClpP protease-like protein
LVTARFGPAPTFVGTIDQASFQRVIAGIAAAMANKVQEVHLLFQSTGGTVADGICLYNFLHRLPVEISLYNVGTVASIGALAYLGAKIRPGSLPGHCDCQSCHRKMVQDRSERLPILLDAIVAGKT